MSTNTSFNNLFSDEDIFNHPEQVSLTNRFEISEDLNILKQDVHNLEEKFDKFKEDTEKRFERIENALFATTKQREQTVAPSSPLPPPPSNVAPILPESFLEPKLKSSKAILQALTDIAGSAEQADVNDDIKKTSWSALSTVQKDLKDSIINEVVQEVKEVLPQFPYDLNGNDWIIQFLLRKRWNNVGASQRRREGNESNRRRRINS
ncbi:hypothetical protein INT45_012673 [Circinella minor]|uniref:Uncharacterized protein n=1 Tax=Circinella minor TaxID=1195481 RepID=A0A8H7R7E9_9FUNG|nr:hypothetical protein INT45_012673 [Circinella minor]